jgi:hypothetical protein
VGRPGDEPQVPPTDEQAIERYQYMLKTAPPETIEQAHAEAFARLTPEQRRVVLAKLAENAPAAERAAIEQGGGNPRELARMATRAEIRQPGAMQRMFGQGGGMGMGMGGMLAGSLLGSIAGTVIGSMIAQQFFADHGTAGLEGSGLDSGGDAGAASGDDVAMGDGDAGGADLGGEWDGGGFDV